MAGYQKEILCEVLENGRFGSVSANFQKLPEIFTTAEFSIPNMDGFATDIVDVRCTQGLQ